MNERVIRHEIKLQKSVIFILALLAVGVFAMAFMPLFSAKNALAELNSFDSLNVKLDGKVELGGLSNIFPLSGLDISLSNPPGRYRAFQIEMQ